MMSLQGDIRVAIAAGKVLRLCCCCPMPALWLSQVTGLSKELLTRMYSYADVRGTRAVRWVGYLGLGQHDQEAGSGDCEGDSGDYEGGSDRCEDGQWKVVRCARFISLRWPRTGWPPLTLTLTG